jgi:hypothetical protein
MGAGEAGDAVNPRSLNGFGQGHRREHGGETARQHRRACSRGPQNWHVVDICQHRLSLYFLNPELTGDVAFAPFNGSDGGRVAGQGSLDH